MCIDLHPHILLVLVVKLIFVSSTPISPHLFARWQRVAPTRCLLDNDIDQRYRNFNRPTFIIIIIIETFVTLHLKNEHKSYGKIDNSEEKQEAQLMLTNPLDAFTDQSRSPNMVPFDMFQCAIVTLSVRHTVFEIFDFKNAMTLKTGLG